MEFSEDRQFDPIPQDTGMSLPPEEPSADAYPAPDIPVSETPVPESPADTAWHGAGVDQQEFFTVSPAAAARTEPDPTPDPEPEPEPVYERTYTPQPEEYTVPKKRAPKPKKSGKAGKAGRRILAAVLTAALVVGSCAVTAGLVSRSWEKRMLQHQTQVDTQIDALQQQIRDLEHAQTGVSVSGSPMASAEGLSPSQVYAMNVGSVVAISNQSTTNVWGQVSETASSGTGFIISADGYILSNYHVVEGANKLTVMTYMGDEYEAQLIGFDEMNDVSILKIEAAGLDPVTIGSSDDLIVGDQVVAIGNPLGELTSSLTVGYISAKDRTINTDGNLINMMQTDAAINPGNSGGPLFNMKGEVVGITTAKYSGSTGSGASIEGIGFAIPIADVMAMSDDLIAHGYRTNQAYLGVTVRDMDASTADMYALPIGSYVISVTEGSCAEKAGMQPKDIIIKVGEHPVDGNSTLQSALRKFKAGETTTITVFRSGAELELTITFDERPQDPHAELEQPQGQGEMPSSGSYEDWYNYFFPFFGGGMP